MRIIELIEHTASPLTRCLLDDTCAVSDDQHVVRTIGPSGWIAGHLAVRRALRGEFDAVRCWSMALGRIVSRVAPRMRQSIVVQHGPIGRPGVLRRACFDRSQVTFEAMGASVRAALIDAGYDGRRVKVVEPRVDADRIMRGDREAMRLQLGVGDAATRIAMLVGDEPDQHDVVLAALAAGLVDETGRPMRLVIAPGTPGHQRALRVVNAAHHRERIITTRRAERPWEILDACDCAIAVSGGLTLAWARAAGLSIAAMDRPGVRDQLTDGPGTPITPAANAGELARSLRRFIDEADSTGRNRGDSRPPATGARAADSP